MTREEQIRKAADDYCGDDTREQSPCFYTHIHNAFLEGIGWADSHPHWIPVEERLPEKENEFEDYSKLVVVTNGKDFWKGMYNYGGEDWLTFDLWLIDDATHWMEIVPPRKED